MFRDFLTHKGWVSLVYLGAASSGLLYASGHHGIPIMDLVSLFLKDNVAFISIGVAILLTGWLQLMVIAGRARKGTLRNAWFSRNFSGLHAILGLHGLLSVIFCIFAWLMSIANTTSLGPQLLLMPALGMSYLYAVVLFIAETDHNGFA